MTLYIKQKVFSFTDRYNIYTEDEQAVYEVYRKPFTWGAQIHINDLAGNEVLFIKRKVTFLLAEYEIYEGQTLRAVVNQEFSMFRPRLTISSPDGQLELEGQAFGMNFSILRSGYEMGSIEKAWFTFGDSYRLEVRNAVDAPFFCALVIAIDNCLHNDNHG